MISRFFLIGTRTGWRVTSSVQSSIIFVNITSLIALAVTPAIQCIRRSDGSIVLASAYSPITSKAGQEISRHSVRATLDQESAKTTYNTSLTLGKHG